MSIEHSERGRPYAPDWKPVEGTRHLSYSPSKHIWWCDKRKEVFDERSARHNGLIGAGAQLKEMISDSNS